MTPPQLITEARRILSVIYATLEEEKKGTPGPWQIGGGYSVPAYIEPAGSSVSGPIVCEFDKVADEFRIDDEQTASNAALIVSLRNNSPAFLRVLAGEIEEHLKAIQEPAIIEFQHGKIGYATARLTAIVNGCKEVR